MPKQRADLLLVESGLFESRTAAQRAIMAGAVRVGADHVVRNASEKWSEETVFTVAERCPYVGRGAYKLLPALDAHLPDLSGTTALDVGASTGGFTDLMLQRGAVKVYAVDVGHGQLHLKLREDPRVVCLEKVNARYLSVEQIPEPIDVVTIDVSFISLTKILPPLVPLLKDDAWIFALVKPQFEAQRHEVGKGGVIRDDAVRLRCNQEIGVAATGLGWSEVDIIPSPITGPKGNQESIWVGRN
jgi:23S rRNA (cytidine1920-2'-O)/16S rRNA (cytidine1409-2'-O)-methyltransferase